MAPEMLKSRPDEQQRQDAARDRERNARQRQQTIAQRVEQRVEQNQDQGQANRHHDGETLLRLLQFLELAGPFQAIAARQLHVGGDPCAGLGHRAAQIAVAHAELDGNEAFVLLVEDIRRAGIERDGRESRSTEYRRCCRPASV